MFSFTSFRNSGKTQRSITNESDIERITVIRVLRVKCFTKYKPQKKKFNLKSIQQIVVYNAQIRKIKEFTGEGGIGITIE